MDDGIDYNALVELDDGDGGCGIRSMKVFDGKGYYVTLRLSDIPFSTIASIEDDEGRDVQGLFIPFKGSGLTVTKKRNVLLVCKAELAQVASPKHTHLLSQICDRDVLVERRRLGFKECFIGHMAPIGYKKKGNKQ